MHILQKRSQHDEDETPKPGDAIFRNVQNHVIATAHQSLAAAAQFFCTQNVTPLILGDTVTGEAREVAKVFAALAREIRRYEHPFKPPVALISGGETTVTVKGQGRGDAIPNFYCRSPLHLMV